MTVTFMGEYKTHAGSEMQEKDFDPLISPSIGYISAGGNVGYIFCINQSQFDTWRDEGNTGRQFKSSIVITHVTVSIGYCRSA